MTQIENRKDITVPMDETLVEEIHDELGYGDSRAEWVRRAVRKELDRIKNGDDPDGDTDGGDHGFLTDDVEEAESWSEAGADVYATVEAWA